MWDSVFWNEDNYRPDRTTKTLNEIIKKLDTETQKKLTDMFQKAEKQSEVEEKSTSNNNDVEISAAQVENNQNELKDANEKEKTISQETDLNQSNRNQTRDDKSKSNRVEAGTNFGGFGISFGVNLANGNSYTHNTERQNEKTENTKKNSFKYNRNLENKEKIQHDYNANNWANVERISSTIASKMANDSDNSRRVEKLKEDVEKLLEESRIHVQWDGEKFVPKPMQLSRINLGKFRDAQLFQDRNVRVRYTNAELSAPIKFMEHTELTVTDEWNNLKVEFQATAELLNTTMMDLVKMSAELRHVKSDLNNTRIDLTNKLKETSTTNLASTRTELNSTISVISDLTQKLNDRTSEIIDIGKMPTSCSDLHKMGHKVSGFFSVKGSKKMEMIYCKFNPDGNVVEQWIGYADVKSQPVHFYVQRESSFKEINTSIPFDLAQVNEGNAMDLKSGKFTAPRTGTFFFSFTATAHFPPSSIWSSIYVILNLNGSTIGKCFIVKGNSEHFQNSPLTIQSTLNLKKGEQVWLEISRRSPDVSLYDDSSHRTHFVGFMLEEEIMTSF